MAKSIVDNRLLDEGEIKHIIHNFFNHLKNDDNEKVREMKKKWPRYG